MRINITTWTIQELIDNTSKINPKPQYQRTPVWSHAKKVFLIDSILREYDIPKFYIKSTPTDLLYDWEVTDGQQRMRSIWEFQNNEFAIEAKEINGVEYRGCKFNDLPQDYKDRFVKYKLTISEITDATQEELRTLFARLQMGMSLLPVELRHALASNIGTALFTIADTHKFFKDCKIPNIRFKHQDYLDHVIALVYYENSRDIKAPTLYQLYLDLAAAQISELSNLLKNVNKVLDWMHEINTHSKGIFKNKWGFVDTFWLLYQNYNSITSIKYKAFARSLSVFEQQRKKYNSKPELLIEDKTSLEYDKNLYDYIDAFNRQGSVKRNIAIRHRVFVNKFNNEQNLILR